MISISIVVRGGMDGGGRHGGRLTAEINGKGSEFFLYKDNNGIKLKKAHCIFW